METAKTAANTESLMTKRTSAKTAGESTAMKWKRIMTKRDKKQDIMDLTYSWEGNDYFVVNFNPKKVTVVSQEGQVKFVAINKTLRIEVL